MAKVKSRAEKKVGGRNPLPGKSSSPDPSADGSTPLRNYLQRQMDAWLIERKPFENEWDQDYRAFMCEYKKELKDGEGDDWRSRIFLPTTRNKINAATAHFMGITMQDGEIPFDIKPSPIPDSENNEILAKLGFGLAMRTARMKKLIRDQLVECGAKDEVFDAVNGGAIYGTAAVKCPVIETRKRVRYEVVAKKAVKIPEVPPGAPPEFMEQIGEILKDAITVKPVYTEEAVPAAKNLDIWDVVVDPLCSGDIQTGNGIYHISRLSPADTLALRDLEDTTGEPIYDRAAITEEVRQLAGSDDENTQGTTNRGSSRINRGPHRESKTGGTEIAVIEFAGKVPVRYLDSLEQWDFSEETKGLEDGDYVEVIMTFTENRIFRAIPNPYPGKLRPFHLVQWERLPGSPYGRGIARAMRDSQSLVNGLTRAYVDNKNLSSCLMFVIDESMLQAGADSKLTVGKKWRTMPGVNANDIVKTIQIPDVTGGILQGVEMGFKIGDDAAGIPRIWEGVDSSKPETAYATGQKLSAAGQQLGLVIRYYDQRIISSIVRALYHWNMEFVDDFSIKGDYDIVATGFNSFQSREIKLRALKEFTVAIGQLPGAMNAIKLGPYMKQYATFLDVDSDALVYSDSEIAENAKNQGPSEDMQIAQAKMQMKMAELENKLKAVQLQGQLDMAKLQLEQQLIAQRELGRLQIKGQEADKDRELGTIHKLMEGENIMKRETLKATGNIAVKKTPQPPPPGDARGMMPPAIREVPQLSQGNPFGTEVPLEPDDFVPPTGV